MRTPQIPERCRYSPWVVPKIDPWKTIHRHRQQQLSRLVRKLQTVSVLSLSKTILDFRSKSQNKILFWLRSFIENSSYRWAYQFVCAVNAANPATGSTHPLNELRNHPSYMILSRFRLLDRNCPTNPLISSERWNIPPCRKRFRRSGESFLQIRWRCMHCSRGDFHTSLLIMISIANWSLWDLNWCRSSKQGVGAQK